MLSSSSPHKLLPTEVKILQNRSTFDRGLLKHSVELEKLHGSLPHLNKAEANEEKDIVVCVRARPILAHESSQGLFGSVTTDRSGQNVYLHSLESNIQGIPVVKTKDFNVDAAFDGASTNEEVYEATAKGLIPLVLGGGVGSLFAYGQTGSGKTFTMTAIEKMVATDLFNTAEDISQGGEPSFEIRACFFELLGNQAGGWDVPGSVTILEDVFGRIQVKGAKEALVTSAVELLELIEFGAAQRRTEGTAKNATSSRTHAILRIRVTNLRLPEAEDGLMYLLDLAGSESSADTRWHNKERVQESVEINKSLATLKDCIRNRALATVGGKHVHILDTSQSLSTLRYIAPLKVSIPKSEIKINPDDPSHWSNEQLRQWVLGAQETGKQLLRLPEADFIERCMECGVGSKEAKKFYLKLWKLLIDSRTKTRNTKMKDLSQRVNAESKKKDQEFDRALADGTTPPVKTPIYMSKTSSSEDMLSLSSLKLQPSEVRILEGRSTFDEGVLQYSMELKKSTSSKSSLPKLNKAEAEANEDKDIVVCVRARPLLEHESSEGLYSAVTADQSGQNVYLHTLEPNVHGHLVVKTKDFKVDAAFDGNSTNEEVYEATAKSLIPIALGGGVGSLFAYGQTGSGKTYTMTAIEKLVATDLFTMAKEMSKEGEPTFEIRACFFELLGKQAGDLLTDSAPGSVSIMEDVFGRIQVKGAKEVLVTTAMSFWSLSNMALLKDVRKEPRRMLPPEDGLMYLLDLAGSEGSADTRWHNKERVQESVEINKSLATLKDCIRNRALATVGGKHVHVPYRTSRLTVLLKEAFELSSARICKTVVIAALNPSILDTSQSLSTLRYIAPLKVSVPKSEIIISPNDPSHWSNERLREWVLRAQGDVKSIDPDVLCPKETGKQLLRLPEADFISRCVECGVGPKEAKKFYVKLWKLLIDSRTSTRNTKMKELSQRVNAESKKRDAEIREAMLEKRKGA
ncbi:P-loop containing nucleoside triphosphate hydrolase protein [Chytridium lagenaria]|nr:P-loop containing nucleoside triphosphate hydrolase protein [Chytridium lagenaria]